MALSTYQQLVDAGVTSREMLIALLTGVDPITGDVLTVNGGAVSTFDALKTGNVTERELLAALVAKQDPLTGAGISGLGGAASNFLDSLRAGTPPITYGFGTVFTAHSQTAVSWGVSGSASVSSSGTSIWSQQSTAAATTNSAVAYLANIQMIPGNQVGFECVWAVSAVADGKAWCGYSDGNPVSVVNAAFLTNPGNALGIGYDKSLGHANWQFVSKKNFAAPVYVDSGIVIAATTPLLMVVDHPPGVDPVAEIRDPTTRALLASHSFPSANQMDAAATLQEGIAIGSPGTGSPAARALRYYLHATWRRKSF